MIKKLDNSNEKVALQIFTVFQNSYKIEAKLLGVVDFPPLLRSIKDIENSKTLFYGFTENACLAAIIEIVIKDKHIEINSLTVAPGYFRKGFANLLLRYVLENIEFSDVIVETAVENIPAINLYKKHGFVEFKRWTPSHGIQKLALCVKNPR